MVPTLKAVFLVGVAEVIKLPLLSLRLMVTVSPELAAGVTLTVTDLVTEPV